MRLEEQERDVNDCKGSHSYTFPSANANSSLDVALTDGP